MMERLWMKPYLLSLMALRPSALFGVVMAQPFYAELLHSWADRAVATHADILELGCGPGGLSLYLAERRGATVLGMDRSPSMIRAAQRQLTRSLHRLDLADPLVAQLSRARFAVGDATDTNLPDRSFDCVLGASILNVADPVKLVREARRLTRGHVAFLVPSRQMNPVAAARVAEQRQLPPRSRAVLEMWSRHARKMDEGELTRVFRQADAGEPQFEHHLDQLVLSVSAER